MDVLLSTLFGASITFFTAKDIIKSITPWSDKVIDMCFHPANNDAQGNLRVVYSGFSSTLDRSLCAVVNFFQNCLHDDLGAPILALLLTAFGTAMAIMAIEGSRHGFRKSLLALFPLYGLLANAVGIYAVFSFLWIPMHVFYKRSAFFKKDHWNITQAQVYGILGAVLLGFGLPSVFFLPWVKADTRLEQDVLALWQGAPLFVATLIPVLVRFFQQPSEIDQVRDQAERNRLYIAQGKSALEKSYLILAIFNVFVYFGSYWAVAHQGIHLWDSLILLQRAPNNLPEVSFGDLGQILTTRTVMVDFAVLSLGFIGWATFDGGLLYGLLVILGIPLIGPSAAISLYACYREDRVQNLTSTNPAFEKDFTPTDFSPVALDPIDLSPIDLSPIDLSPADISS
ncbi:unnamed protein product [Rhizopus stolonifer]